MESYDEFARRARIITEIHAIPAIASVDCAGNPTKTDNGDSSKADIPKQSALQKKEKDAKKKSLKQIGRAHV